MKSKPSVLESFGQMGLFHDERVRLKESRKSKKRTAEWRAKALEVLGGRCVKCGFADERALEIDHIHQLEKGSRAYLRGYQRYRAIANGEITTDEVQLLCANCHSIKTRENGEHLAAPKSVMIRQKVETGEISWLIGTWINCQSCGKMFLAKRRESERRRYCQLACQNAFQKQQAAQKRAVHI